jgi:phage shock protein E
MSDFREREKEYGLASAEQTRAALAQPDTIVLDIRTPEEIAANGGMIAHPNVHQVTVSLTDASALVEQAPTLLPQEDKDKSTIFIYCRSGRRATKAVSTLQDMGYTNVMNGGGYDDVQTALSQSTQVLISQ